MRVLCKRLEGNTLLTLWTRNDHDKTYLVTVTRIAITVYNYLLRWRSWVLWRILLTPSGVYHQQQRNQATASSEL